MDFLLVILNWEQFLSISKAYAAFDIATTSPGRKQATAGAGRISTIRPIEPGKVAAKY